MNIEYYTVDQFLYRANIAESKNLMPYFGFLKKNLAQNPKFQLISNCPFKTGSI